MAIFKYRVIVAHDFGEYKVWVLQRRILWFCWMNCKQTDVETVATLTWVHKYNADVIELPRGIECRKNKMK